MLEFQAWPSIPRLRRNMMLTEKIDGTNACINIDPNDEYRISVQSRKRIITPDDDNFGFARWVQERAQVLTDVLGPGRHYGEFWGSGVQRGYGMRHGEKRFSLFNAARWRDLDTFELNPAIHEVDGLDVVPILHVGDFDMHVIDATLQMLREYGSVAAPGFAKPEGVVVKHLQSGHLYKVLLENDDISKTEAGLK